MRKVIILVCILGVIILNGCDMNSKNSIYSNERKISSKTNSFNLRITQQSVNEEGYEGEIQFEGVDTIWKCISDSESEVDVSYLLSLTKGMAKLVLIKPDGEVETIVESEKEVDRNNIISTKIALEKGENIIKLVGKNDAQIYLKLKVPSGEFYTIGFNK